MANEFQTGGMLGVDFTRVDTSQEFDLGLCVSGTKGSKWMYCSFSSTVAQYDAVGIVETFVGASLTKALADEGAKVGFAQVAFASGEYGWVALEGMDISVTCLASCAADVALYTTATAGSLDDDSTSQTKIEGVTLVSAVGGGGAAAATCKAVNVKATV